MASPTLQGATAASVQFQQTCFGCGHNNPHGLQIEFRIDSDGSALASWVPDMHWEGLRGIVHGGIVTTLLDEAMAKAVAARGWNTMTADLRVRFRQYARTGEVVRIKGWIASHNRRVVESEATVMGPDGSEHAHAWAKFLAVTKSNASAPARRGGE